MRFPCPKRTRNLTYRFLPPREASYWLRFCRPSRDPAAGQHHGRPAGVSGPGRRIRQPYNHSGRRCMTRQNSIDTEAVHNRAVDPVTASVILGALEQIAVEMGYKLMRMAYSSIIRESEDFG